MNTMNTVRVRFAPSPTGHLHIGGLRSALFNWLFARHHGGVFLLRIEDTDLERSRPEYTQSILQSFEWCDLMPDEPVLIQSERIGEHHRLLDQLLDEQKAYRCFCTPEELKARLVQHHGQELDYTKYDRLCRDKKITEQDLKKPFAIRFKLPDHGIIEFTDLIRGSIAVDVGELDDFVIARSDKTPMYNFVVVVDDAYMRITHIIRGEEHISNTPKQILLYQALGYPIPAFAHLPIILGPDGSKLSKRDGATAVIEYKREGYLPAALCNYLVRLGWGHGDQEIFTRAEMIEYFTLEAVQKRGAVFDKEKLRWINGMYVRQLADGPLLQAIIDNSNADLIAQTAAWNDMQRQSAINVYKQRVSTLKELADEVVHLYRGPDSYNITDIATWITSATSEQLNTILSVLQADHDWAADVLSALVKKVATDYGVKLVALAQPLRLAILGKSDGPGVFELMSLVGKKVCVERIERLIDYIPTFQKKEKS